MKTRTIGWQRGDTTGTRQPTLIAPSAHSQTKPPWICRCSSAHIMWPWKTYLGGAHIYMIIYSILYIYVCDIYDFNWFYIMSCIYYIYIIYTVLKHSLKQYLRTSKSPLTVGCHYHETIKLIKHLEEKIVRKSHILALATSWLFFLVNRQLCLVQATGEEDQKSCQ